MKLWRSGQMAVCPSAIRTMDNSLRTASRDGSKGELSFCLVGMRDNPPRGRNRLSPKLLKTPTLLLSCPSSNAIVVGWVELWRGRVCECEWEMRRRMR
eukprot:scaffold78342_cov26-Tisochrysis_lutea.AAC.4